MDNPVLQKPLFQTYSLNYMEEFKCIGSECEDSCCVGWTIPLNKQVVKKYKGSSDPEIREKAKNSIKKGKSLNRPDQFGVIPLADGEPCPFLDGCGLCSIQTKLGEDSLSKTCNTFPRKLLAFPDNEFIAATLACPETARLCLSSKSAADLNVRHLPRAETPVGHAKYHFLVAKDSNFTDTSGQILQAFFNLIDDESLDLAAKSACLSLFVEELVKSDQGLDFIDFLRSTNPIKGLAQQVSGAIPEAKAALLQYQFMKKLLLDPNHPIELGKSKMLNLIYESCRGLKYYDKYLAQSVGTFLAAKKDLYEPFLSEHPYVWGNILKNDLISNPEIMALGNSESREVLEAAVSRLSIIKFLFIAQAGYKGTKPRLEDLARVVTVVRRFLDHSSQRLEKFRGAIREIDQSSTVVNALLLL